MHACMHACVLAILFSLFVIAEEAGEGLSTNNINEDSMLNSDSDGNESKDIPKGSFEDAKYPYGGGYYGGRRGGYYGGYPRGGYYGGYPRGGYYRGGYPGYRCGPYGC